MAARSPFLWRLRLAIDIMPPLGDAIIAAQGLASRTIARRQCSPPRLGRLQMFPAKFPRITRRQTMTQHDALDMPHLMPMPARWRLFHAFASATFRPARLFTGASATTAPAASTRAMTPFHSPPPPMPAPGAGYIMIAGIHVPCHTIIDGPRLSLQRIRRSRCHCATCSTPLDGRRHA